jgi:DNA-binding transcriptional LysR family regulator
MSVLDLKNLESLDAVVNEGSFRRAATLLGYAQSSVSQQIASLERSVGGEVLERSGGNGRVRLTALGELVLESGRDLLERARTAQRRISQFHAGGGRVDIATFQTVTNVLLPSIVRRLQAQRPGCDIRLVEEETATPLDGVDLVFFDGPAPPDSGAEDTLLLQDPHVLIAPRGAFAPGAVALDALHRTPMVALPPITTQREVEAVLTTSGIDPLIVFRTADNQGLVSMVRAGLGYAILPFLAVNVGLDDPGLAMHPLRPALRPRPIHLIWRSPLSPLARDALEITLAVAAAVARTAQEVADRALEQ